MRLLVTTFFGMTIVGMLASGCAVFDAGINSNPDSGSREIDPKAGIEILMTGLATHVDKLEVTANGAPVKAKIASGRLLVNGKRELDTDTEYEVWIRQSNPQDRALRRLVFNTVSTPRPEVPPGGFVAKQDGGAEVKWNIPLKSFTYELTPAVDNNMSMNNDKRTARIEIPDYKQGQKYSIKITGAEGVNGYKLKKEFVGMEVPLSTTTALMVDLAPGYGAREVSRSTSIVMTFNDIIANPEAAAGFFSVEPAVPGTFSWPAANKLMFTPASSWDYETMVTARLKSGLKGLRGVTGGYMESDVESVFETGVFKKIDINLSTQTLVLLEGGTPVYSCLVSSGKSGYSTPTGDYHVYAKDRVAPMSSAENAVEFYYIPDVPFVMWFNGNYSIHGAYWHNDFGNVRSHGCVNISVGDGESVFSWAPVGTPVTVHY